MNIISGRGLIERIRRFVLVETKSDRFISSVYAKSLAEQLKFESIGVFQSGKHGLKHGKKNHWWPTDG